jgi:hypothetical protein
MQRRTVDPSELDENMSDETKRFVTNFLSSTDPRAILRADLNIVRHMRSEQSKLTNGSVLIENVTEKEFHVKSHIDGYEIPVNHSRLYRDKLVSNDIKCELHIIKGVHHGFFNAPGLMPNAFAEARGHIVNYLHRIRNNEI